MVISAEEGEKIYQEVCTACHAFDRVVLGPAHDITLKKYVDNPDDLVEFLKNPTKVDPAFPAMPNPGLTTHKIKSVVKFLMGRMGKEWPAGSGNKEGEKKSGDQVEDTKETGAETTEPGSMETNTTESNPPETDQADTNKTETTETMDSNEKKNDSENKDKTAADGTKADSQVK
jgi:cytochrome c551/c552